MTRFRCDSCNEDRDHAVCLKCGASTRELSGGGEVSLEEAAAALRNAPLKEPLVTSVPPPRATVFAQPKRRELKVVEPEPPPRPPAVEPIQAPQAEVIGGLDEFHALLERGVKSVILCGGPKTGKSEIAAGFIRAKNIYRGEAQVLTLRAPLRTEYSLGGTTEEVWYQVIDGKRTFLDPSGEFFRLLDLEYRKKFGLPDLTDNDFRFIQRAVQQLAGVILVVDLTQAVDPRAMAAWRQQEEHFNFVLAALRWLRWDREARPPNIGYVVNIAQRAKLMPLIDKPVLVLFSKADRLTKLTNENPLRFARRRLPVLHGAVMTHSRRFRYDFCHTMIQRGGRDVEIDHPCGVLLPIEWMLDDRFRRFPLQLPTRLLGGGK